eukprot:CAMPEP_0171108638 /NCGR_PEP_ID=MMETSP0766_2-20121228/69330_1 /TAXON_ID=439317 /ORGANISM="Gambierdiscus australes, Strain CAWD 149" /LENGTH=453 /DNA_ID=CAMNT_0011570215 /DNA_START=42 /DNA_END=1403 /DNA_ORIENTATION=+
MSARKLRAGVAAAPLLLWASTSNRGGTRFTQGWATARGRPAAAAAPRLRLSYPTRTPAVAGVEPLPPLAALLTLTVFVSGRRAIAGRSGSSSTTAAVPKKVVEEVCYPAEPSISEASKRQYEAVKASELEREAARLRAEAEGLEAELGEQRKQEKARWFFKFDEDNSGAVDVHELQKGMKEYSGTELNESQAERLLEAHDENKDGLLQQSEFDIQRLEATSEKLVAEDREREVEAWRAERREQERLRVEQEAAQLREQYEAKLPPTNEDTSVLVRLASVFVYLLPLLDSLQFSVPLATAVPQVDEALTPLLGPLSLMRSVPYGQLIAFIIIQTLADVRELPLLLRYNMRQAAVLDILLGTLRLTQVLAAIAAFGSAPQDLVEQWDSNTIVFLLLVGCIAYSSASSLLGQIPRDIPGISAYTERYLAPTRPSRKAEETGGDKAAPSSDGPLPKA